MSLQRHLWSKFKHLFVSAMHHKSGRFQLNVCLPQRLLCALLFLVANLCRHYGEWLISQRNYPLAVRDLRDAITRLRANNTQLTPLHPHYIKVIHSPSRLETDCHCVQACILAKMYHMASHVVDIDSTELSGGVQARDLVLFFYYGGIALIGQKKFKRAQMFFQMGLAVPTTTVNAIGVETYKKLVLVSLLVDGKLPPLGRILSGAILRNIQVGAGLHLIWLPEFVTHVCIRSISASHTGSSPRLSPPTTPIRLMRWLLSTPSCSLPTTTWVS